MALAARAVSGEYLLEVLAEEIPARMLEAGMRDLATRVFEDLMARGLGPRGAELATGETAMGSVETAYTPRRLTLVLTGLPERELDRVEDVVGPPVTAAFKNGEATEAAKGFAKRQGKEIDELFVAQIVAGGSAASGGKGQDKKPAAILGTLADLGERARAGEKGLYLADRVNVSGRATRDVLAEIVPRALSAIPWPKTMRWGAGEGPWVRPIHRIVSLFGGEIVPFTLFGIEAQDTTSGHPTLSPAPFQVSGAADYRAQLLALGIEPRAAERRKALLAGMRAEAGSLGGTLVEDGPLLDKLAALCEIPGVMSGRIDASFLALPQEVLATSLRDHQSALTVVGADGKLLPAFLTVMDRPDDPIGRVRSGNEWVVSARLADARFFYGEDRKRRLEEGASRLSSLNFQEKLGSYAEKTERVVRLAGAIAHELGVSEEVTAQAVRAAQLLKIDLTTEMVKEFTSLQGVMGGIYAREDGEPEAVWQAIYDQYLPASTEDSIPRGLLGRIVGLADRLDTLVGLFGLGLVPTGSKDPFGLRRAAQGAVRIALDGGLALDLERLASVAIAGFGTEGSPGRLTREPQAILSDLRPFLHDRIRHLLGLKGYAYDEIEAALGAGAENLPDLAARAHALQTMRGKESFLTVVQAAKRIANILKDAPPMEFSADKLVEPAECDLYAEFDARRSDLLGATTTSDHGRALERVAELGPALDRFFTEILVNDPDPERRSNRIGLLQTIGLAISFTAKLTEMVVEKR